MNAIKTEIFNLYKRSLKPSSAWYTEDLSAFLRELQAENNQDKLNRMLATHRALSGLDPKFNAFCDKEEKRMEKAGMYDMNKMKPSNALD